MFFSNRFKSVITASGLSAAIVLSSYGLANAAAMLETEANDTAATANALTTGNYGTGSITPASDIDFWSIGGASVGDLIFTYVDTQNSSTGPDSQLNVYANDGTTLIEFDDDDGPGLRSAVAGAIAPQNGNVIFRINEFLDNGTITPYDIYVAVVSPSDAATESEANDTSATADAITAAMMTGSISGSGSDVDFFSFFATTGQRIALIVDDNPDDDTNRTDTEIDILDTDGVTILAMGDDSAGNDANAAGAVTALSGGTYYVRIRDGVALGGDTDYRFVLLLDGAVYSAQDIPEPGTLALFGLGLAGLGFARRRKAAA